MKRYTHILIAVLLLVSSCDGTHEITNFSDTDAIRLEVAGITQFFYDPITCQMAFNRERGEFRVHTDSMSDYFIIEDMSDIPTEEGQEIVADIIWTTRNDIMARKKITLKVIRLQGDKVWLWSSYGRIGAELRILD